MPDENKIKNQAEQIKKYMEERQLSFIRNNERFRNELEMNKHNLTFVLKYLKSKGFLEPWNKKLYHISNNSN